MYSCLGCIFEYITQKYNQDMNTWNIHRESRNIRNTDDSLSSGTKLLLPSWLLRIQHEERETHNFYYADCSSIVTTRLTDLTNAHAHLAVHKLDWPRPVQISTHCFYSKSRSPSLPGMTSFTSPVIFSIWRFIVTSMIITSSPHAREHLR